MSPPPENHSAVIDHESLLEMRNNNDVENLVTHGEMSGTVKNNLSSGGIQKISSEQTDTLLKDKYEMIKIALLKSMLKVDTNQVQNDFFLNMDQNDDADISFYEFKGSDLFFNRVDTDGDGLIQVEEQNSFLDHLAHLGITGLIRSELEYIFGEQDTDKDGYLSQDEFYDAAVFIYDFEYFDKDEDNYVSFEEYKKHINNSAN